MAAGPAPGRSGVGLDADRINLVLDALDEAYQQIIVMGRYNEARQLFQTIEGRFDAGLIVSNQAMAAEPNVFLGFEVSDIEIVHHVRAEGSAAATARVPAQRLKRVTAGPTRRAGAAVGA